MRNRDVPECRRLLATGAPGSASWLYAGVTFRDLPAPATACTVIATACLELLAIGLDIGSAAIVGAAADLFQMVAAPNEPSASVCVAVGAIPPLLTATRRYRGDLHASQWAWFALGSLVSVGSLEFELAGAIPLVISAFKMHEDERGVLVAVLICVSSMSTAVCASFVARGGVPALVAAFRRSTEKDIAFLICFTQSLACIAMVPRGVEAAVAAGAVPALVVACSSVRARAKHVLGLLGFDEIGRKIA